MSRWTQTPEERFWSKVDKTGDCWLWAGGNNGSGLPSYWHNGKVTTAPRVAWELKHGPLEPGITVIRTCEHKLCVRHLDALPNIEAQRRMQRAVNARRVARTHCPRGHRYGTHGNGCKTCRYATIDRYKKKRRTARTIARTAHWSPNIQRWLINEGPRWIRGTDQEARHIIRQHLRDAGQLPRDDHGADRAVRDMRLRVMALYQPDTEEEAA